MHPYQYGRGMRLPASLLDQSPVTRTHTVPYSEQCSVFVCLDVKCLLKERVSSIFLITE